MRPKADAPAPFSRLIDVDRLREGGEDITIAADPKERAAVAAENDLLGLGRLEARFHVVRHGRDGARATGQVSADVTQRCVVSLDPFETALVEPVDVLFAPPRAVAAAAPDGDAPDPLIDGKIDLGRLATEFFVLGLDPYPHKPGVAFEDRIDPATGSPFDALRKLAERS